MDTNTKINQIIQALNMREEIPNSLNPSLKDYIPTVKGEQRTALIAELVRLLTIV